jgi:sugar phosphate isomerase/epimerase
MLKLGINSGGIFRTLGIEEGFRQLALCGFDSVDLDLTWLLPFRYPYTDPVNKIHSKYEDMTDEELLEQMRPYKELSQKYGVAIGQAHAVDPPFVNDPENDARLLRILQKTILICGYLECPYLIIHPAHCEYEENTLTPEDEWEANLHMLGECIPALKQHNVVACLENMYIVHGRKAYSSTCQCPYEASRYVDTLNAMAGEKRFAFCLDTGHSLMVGMQLNNVIRTLGHRLETLHLNDNDGIGDLHQIPRQGILHWEKVIEGLRSVQYRNTLNFELYMPYSAEEMPKVLQQIAAIGREFSDLITGESTEGRTVL